MKTMPRVLVLLFTLSLTSMLFFLGCGLNIDRVLRSTTDGQQARTTHKHEISELKRQIATLKVQMRSMKEELHNNTVQLGATQKVAPPTSAKFDYEGFLARKLQQSEVLHGLVAETEFHLTPFDSFTLNPLRVHLNDPGLGKRVIEMPIGFKRRDLQFAVDTAIEELNSQQLRYKYSVDNFIEGIYRTVPSHGTQYELYFQPKGEDAREVTKAVVFQPFAPVQVVSALEENRQDELVNFIITLSGKLDQFKIFLDQFIKVCILRDEKVFLTIVYFGADGLQEVKSRLLKLSKRYKFTNMKLIPLNETFSRGRGLQVGAQSWTRGDALLFLCDVDMMFSAGFLQRCRLNAEKGKRVYYPVVFSLYNPHVVYSLHEMPVPSLHEQLVISKETGFWRDFGYGMTCQYLSDFNRLGGFDSLIRGWGGEDVMLYRKYVKSNLFVVRATDRGIFHIWHEKKCALDLTDDQYNGCIRSKALNEASHSQLGKLAFKDEINIHKANQKSRKL